jgi:hypothetical protein
VYCEICEGIIGAGGEIPEQHRLRLGPFGKVYICGYGCAVKLAERWAEQIGTWDAPATNGRAVTHA